MVVVKVRETYDLKTTVNKMTVIAIHTPSAEIIKRNWAGLLMNCKFYRPLSADVGIACASTLPLDPQGVGLKEGDVAPEDAFNPILYKACTNESFSNIEARMLLLQNQVADVEGAQAKIDVDTVTPYDDDFNVYYGLLNAGGFAKRMPQDGIVIRGLRPMVHEVLYSFGGASQGGSSTPNFGIGVETNIPNTYTSISPTAIRGKAQPLPRMPCTMFHTSGSNQNEVAPGFSGTNGNSEANVPWLNTLVGCIIIPPARLHELFFRMTVVWSLEFSEIRSIAEIGGWSALQSFGDNTHFINYDFNNSKTLSTDMALASSSVEMKKIME